MNHLKHTSVLIATLLVSFILSSCLFPEEFESEVEIRKNGTFSFSYVGTLTFILAKAKEVKEGKLSLKADKELKELEGELKKDKGFKKVEYIGHSKFKVVYKKEGSLDIPFYFIGKDIRLFTIAPKDNGVIEVQGISLNKKDISKLEAIKLSIDGKLTIKTDGKIIEHNANSTPSLFGLIGGYNWKINSMNDPRPRMLINVKEKI